MAAKAADVVRNAFLRFRHKVWTSCKYETLLMFNFSIWVTMLERKLLRQNRYLSPSFHQCLPKKGQSPSWQGKSHTIMKGPCLLSFKVMPALPQLSLTRMVKNLWRALTPRITIQRPREGTHGQEIVDIQLDSAPLILLRCDEQKTEICLLFVHLSCTRLIG